MPVEFTNVEDLERSGNTIFDQHCISCGTEISDKLDLLWMCLDLHYARTHLCHWTLQKGAKFLNRHGKDLSLRSFSMQSKVKRHANISHEGATFFENLELITGSCDEAIALHLIQF